MRFRAWTIQNCLATVAHPAHLRRVNEIDASQLLVFEPEFSAASPGTDAWTSNASH